MLLQVLAGNEVLYAKVLLTNEMSDVGDDDRMTDRSKRIKTKTRRSKCQKLAKSQKLSKSKGEKSKKLSKSGNSSHFDAIKAGPNFLTSKAKAAVNCL